MSAAAISGYAGPHTIGLVIGRLARAILPGRQRIGILWTLLQY